MRSSPLLHCEFGRRRCGADGHLQCRAAKQRDPAATLRLRHRPFPVVQGHPFTRFQVEEARDVEVLPFRPRCWRGEEVVPLHDVDHPREDEADEVSIPACLDGIECTSGDECGAEGAGYGVM